MVTAVLRRTLLIATVTASLVSTGCSEGGSEPTGASPDQKSSTASAAAESQDLREFLPRRDDLRGYNIVPFSDAQLDDYRNTPARTDRRCDTAAFVPVDTSSVLLVAAGPAQFSFFLVRKPFDLNQINNALRSCGTFQTVDWAPTSLIKLSRVAAPASDAAQTMAIEVETKDARTGVAGPPSVLVLGEVGNISLAAAATFTKPADRGALEERLFELYAATATRLQRG